MHRDRHAQLEEIFHRALELEGAEREAYLETACAGDDALRAQLESLLDEDAGVDEVIEPTVVLARDADGSLPSHIGPYRVLHALGEGGFAVVYAAEQRTPIRRRVAVKVPKRGLDTEQVLARFEAERQALAVMDHPSIARVFDAGETDVGRPYFVMELVDGEPIDRYCARERLDLRQRVELMITVCRAVQHAHHKGVIHRDLKPSNVLVRKVDGVPVPKIIDFGIAKAAGMDWNTDVVFTQHGQFVGTPEYCSPEQADIGTPDVDTRTDIYSLGVLLYELITGKLPFARDSLVKAGMLEVLRILREVEPPKPSTRVETQGAEATEVARSLRTDARTLSRKLRGELDWIVLKSLEKDRDRRYDSAYAMADDLQRYLVGDAVLAGPPSVRYRTRRYVQRHRLLVASISVIVVLILGFAVATTVQANRIARERDRANAEKEVARQVSEFLTSLFQFSDPGESRGRQVSARQLLDDGAARLEGGQVTDPAVRADLLLTLGRVYRRIDEVERAAGYLEESARLHEATLGPRALKTLYNKTSLAIVYSHLDRLAEAESLLVPVVAAMSEELGPEHENVMRTRNALGSVYLDEERYDLARVEFEAVYEIRRRTQGPDDKDTLYGQFALANLLVREGKLQEAGPLMRDCAERLRTARGMDHPNTLAILSSLGDLEGRLGNREAAVSLLREALEGQVRVNGPESSEVHTTRERLARYESE